MADAERWFAHFAEGELATGAFIADQRNAAFIGSTAIGKSQPAIAVARSLIRNDARGRFYNVVTSSNGSRPRTATASRGGSSRNGCNRQRILAFQKPRLIQPYLPFARLPACRFKSD
ncbi:ATP-binding protein (plasmid) [Mesorhizobium sp. AR10]|nr:ATP-binding protein [Mesorhizobium sp. AR10]